MRKRRSRGFGPLGDFLDDRCLLSGYTPAQLTAAYGLSAISFPSSSGATVAGDGSGQTIAIVELYHDPNIQASLDAFDAQYHLPKTTLDVINQAGSQTDDGWGDEESLDVESAHAIAPGANIVVVEVSPGTGSDQEFDNMLAAVRSASRTAGVSVVSMSWGYGEFPDEASYDSNFTTSGITYVASSGDGGAIEWPATSANVLSVGGTSLKLSPSGGYGSETGWNDSGGGLSTTLSEPAYQKGVQFDRRPEHARRLVRCRPLHGSLDLRYPIGQHHGLGTVGGRRRNERRRAGLGRDHRDRQPGPSPGRPHQPDRLHPDRAGPLRPRRHRLQQGPSNLRRRRIEHGDQHTCL